MTDFKYPSESAHSNGELGIISLIYFSSTENLFSVFSIESNLFNSLPRFFAINVAHLVSLLAVVLDSECKIEKSGISLFNVKAIVAESTPPDTSLDTSFPIFKS